MKTLLRTIAAVAMLLTGWAAPAARAQMHGAGPCCLVIGYRTAPAQRAALRAYARTAAAARLETWRQAGLMAQSEMLYTLLPDSALNDVTLIVHFNAFADMARWNARQAEANGNGVFESDSRLGIPLSSIVSDVADELRSGGEAGDPGATVTMILPYKLTVDVAKYQAYAMGYVLPQMDAWVKRGAMFGYALYLNENPAGASWEAMLVLRYRGYEGLAQREVLKAKVRADLSANDAWKKWSLDKTNVRTEGRPTLAEPLVAAGSDGH